MTGLNSLKEVAETMISSGIVVTALGVVVFLKISKKIMSILVTVGIAFVVIGYMICTGIINLPM